MSIQTVFKRYEIKYFLNESQLASLKEMMQPYMRTDAYGKSTIMNIYFDTPTDMLIRHSMEKPVYKEKLRLRSYTVPADDTPVFLEIKKKYDGVVYKRRIEAPYQDMMRYLTDGTNFSDSQIMHEINYFRSYYPELSPHVFLSYDREAFYGINDDSFRITFDRNIRWRKDHLQLSDGNYGERLLPEEQIIMEVKTTGGMPLWLSHFLTNEHMQKGSFSKYGSVYREIFRETSSHPYDRCRKMSA